MICKYGNINYNFLPRSAASGALCLFRPYKNAGTWRGPFEPSTAAFLSERERV